MELEVNGVVVQVSPAEQSNEWLVSAAQEIADAANERGLELSFATGSVAVEGAMRADAAAETSVDPIDVKETITSLLTPAYNGFQTTLEQINGSRKKEKKLAVADQETVAAEFEEWFDEDRLAYVKEKMEANPKLTWTLLATANETVTAYEYLTGTQTFGEGQPHQTKVWSGIVKQYTPEEVSGTDPSNGKSVKFKLVPNEFSPELYGDVATQKKKLAELQADTPFLEATSPLEDLTRLNTLRAANGNKLVGSGTADASRIRNLTLEPQPVGEHLCVPSLCVVDSGRLDVEDSAVQIDEYGRVSVG
jgi:hypothetical protein